MAPPSVNNGLQSNAMNNRYSTRSARPVPAIPRSVTARVLSYLDSIRQANNALPRTGIRACKGVIHEEPSLTSRKYIEELCLEIPAKFGAMYSVVVFDITTAGNIPDAMDICLRQAEQSGPCVFLVDNMDALYPKTSGDEEEVKVNVERLRQVTVRTLRSKFVFFLGFVADLDNLNPAVMKSEAFGKA